ncbi:organic hydroperoxide resistance protein [Sphingomonas sp.]|uniref:organic hydroperoxide resistance protein n=1 Tax=Sphingomonas sp. TaxID=28214 RepID=UPI003BAD459B
MTKILYSTRATATGGRDGTARTDDGTFEVALATPKELGGNGQGNNPEQLFAAGYAACFLSAMKFVGTQGKHARLPADASVSATVGIGPRADKGFGLAVTLDVLLPGLSRDEAEALVAEADTVCPYSHAVRGNISVDLNIAQNA